MAVCQLDFAAFGEVAADEHCAIWCFAVRVTHPFGGENSWWPSLRTALNTRECMDPDSSSESLVAGQW